MCFSEPFDDFQENLSDSETFSKPKSILGVRLKIQDPNLSELCLIKTFTKLNHSDTSHVAGTSFFSFSDIIVGGKVIAD